METDKGVERSCQGLVIILLAAKKACSNIFVLKNGLVLGGWALSIVCNPPQSLVQSGVLISQSSLPF